MSELPENPRVLIVGKDARTDVMADALSRSVHSPTLIGVSEFRAPGLLERCETFYGGESLVDIDRMADIARVEQPDLVVVGPEEPLAAGIVDVMANDLGLPSFGPPKSQARIESSKSWARQLVAEHGIPGNPRYYVCHDVDAISAAVGRLGAFVVKPDGLTGGKGVKLSEQHFEERIQAIDYATELLQASGIVLIEEVLEGEEFSLQTVTDGSAMVHAPLVQDHKRAFEGDTGPNTGGMGSYSCADGSLPFLSPKDVEAAKAINEQVATAIEAETGVPYRGVLYGGFMATRDGVKLIEYNCRFGDPEAMNVLPLLQNDFLKLCWDVAHGQLQASEISFAREASVCRYLVPEGYPTQNKHAGDAITVAGHLSDRARLFWAAVLQEGSRTLLTGSRALACVGYGEDLQSANAEAARLAAAVDGPVFGRADIGSDALLKKRIDHMAALRGT